MAEPFDTAELSGALKDATDPATLARQKGWSEPEQYDYSKYQTAVPVLEKPAEDADQAAPAEWAANAAKYEWNEEFGDVGPPNPELEQMLFRNEYVNRVGLKLGK